MKTTNPANSAQPPRGSSTNRRGAEAQPEIPAQISVELVLRKPDGLRKAKRSLLLIAVLSSQFLMAQTQDGFREASAWFEAELRGKYQIDSIRLPEMNGRLQGSFQVTGDLTPRKLVGKETATNPEETAAAFLEESKTLFGAADFRKDLRRKSSLKDRHGATHISYHRQVGALPLEGAEVTTHIDSKGKIFAVTGNLTPMTPELAAATTPERLNLSIAQATARSAIETDLKSGGVEPERVMQMVLEKVATVDAPYVVWKADVILKNGEGRWLYRVDAFTGMVVAKRSNLQTFTPPSRAGSVPLVASTNHPQGNKPAPKAVKKAPSVGTKEAVTGVGGVQKQETKPQPSQQVAPLTGTKDAATGVGGVQKQKAKPQPSQQAAPLTGTKDAATGVGGVQKQEAKAQPSLQVAPLTGTKDAATGVGGVQKQEAKPEPSRQVAPLTGTKDELPAIDPPQTPQQSPKQ